MSYKQAQKSACADDWEVAVQKELQQLIDFKTCEVIKPEDIPAGKNITGSKIVFKTKLTADGNIEKRKCRIVAYEDRYLRTFIFYVRCTCSCTCTFINLHYGSILFPEVVRVQ